MKTPPIIEQAMLNKILCLSPRELDVFNALGYGLSAKEIADLPGKESNSRNILRIYFMIRKKLELSSLDALRCQAVRFLIYREQNSLVTEDVPATKRPRLKLITNKTVLS